MASQRRDDQVFASAALIYLWLQAIYQASLRPRSRSWTTAEYEAAVSFKTSDPWTADGNKHDQRLFCVDHEVST